MVIGSGWFSVRHGGPSTTVERYKTLLPEQGPYIFLRRGSRIERYSTSHKLQRQDFETQQQIQPAAAPPPTTTMSSASKTLRIVRQLALTATRPTALRPTSSKPKSARILTVVTTYATQQHRCYASQLSTTSGSASMHQDQVTPSQILRRLNELEKSHTATQLEDRKQWRHLYNIDKPLKVLEDEGETVDNERFGGYEGSSVTSQDAAANSEFLRQLRNLKSTNCALRQNQTETMRQLLSLKSTNANLQSEVKSLQY